MTNKQGKRVDFDKYRAFVKKVVEEARFSLYLHIYLIDIKYMEADIKDEKDSCRVASIETDHRYYNATIKCYPELYERWKSGDKWLVKECVIHEMCHILTDPIYKLANEMVTNTNQKFVEDVREQLTQHLTTIVVQLPDLKNLHLSPQQKGKK